MTRDLLQHNDPDMTVIVTCCHEGGTTTLTVRNLLSTTPTLLDLDIRPFGRLLYCRTNPLK